MLLSNPILIKFSAAAAQCMNWALVFNLWPFWIIKMHSKELMLLFFSVKTEPSTAADPPMDKTTVFYIAVGVACGIILIMALAVAAIHVHSMPSPNKEGLVGLLEGLSCFDPFYRVHCSDHQASNYNSLSTVRHKFFISSSPSPRFPKLLEFPPLRISRFKELPPPAHTHTYPSGLCNLFKCVACGSRGGKEWGELPSVPSHSLHSWGCEI